MSTQREWANRAAKEIVQPSVMSQDNVSDIVLTIIRDAIDEFSADNVHRKCRDIAQALRIDSLNWLDTIEAVHNATARIAELEEEVKVDDQLIEGRKRLLSAIPACPDHGACIPHALSWIGKAQADITRMDHLESEEENDSVRSLFRKNMPITRGSVDTRIREVVDERGEA